MRELHLRIRGKVQGVFFRATVHRWAQQLHIQGYVENAPDGEVVVVAQGKQEALEHLKKQCRQGPENAHVEEVIESWRPIQKQYTQFEIR